MAIETHSVCIGGEAEKPAHGGAPTDTCGAGSTRASQITIDPDSERIAPAPDFRSGLPCGPQAAEAQRSDGHQVIDDLPITISRFMHLRDNVPVQIETTWGAFVEQMSIHEHRAAKDGPMFSPVSYRENATRSKDGVDLIYLAVADVDSGLPPEEFLQQLPPDLGMLVVSSHSSTPEHPEYRAICPFAAPCESFEWKQVWPRVQQHVWHGASDPKTSDASRCFLDPSCPEGSEPFVIHRPGRPLDWRALPAALRERPSTAEQGVSHDAGERPRTRNPRGGDEWGERLDVQQFLDGVPEGSRDDGLYKLACSLQAKGYRFEEAQLLMVAAANGCKPPFNRDEALEKLKRVYKKYGDPLPTVNGPAWGRAEGDAPEVHADFHRTDLGNAERLVAAHGKDMRYCKELGAWLIWTGTHWEVDHTGRANRLAKATAKQIWKEIDGAETVEEKKAIGGHAARSESSRSIAAMLQLAETEPGVPIRQFTLDQDRWLLTVENGTLDLRTGELREHRREDYVTKLIPITYDPQAACPRFEQFLSEIMLGRQGLIEYIERVVGYCLTGAVTERCILIFWGGGANGKSTLLEVIADLLGGYAAKTPISTLMVRQGDAIPNDIARLRGARFVYASEGEEGKRLAEAKIKELTGNERIVARFMHAEFFEFDPHFKILMGTNHKPEINCTDDAIWDRVKLIPFGARFEGKQADPKLRDKLRAEMPGILAWAVRGCQAWQQTGLQAPAEVTRAVTGYRAEMDTLALFLADCCVLSAQEHVTVGELHTAYEAWCRDNGVRPLSAKVLASQLTARGAERAKGTGGVRLWLGVGLAGVHHGLQAAA